MTADQAKAVAEAMGQQIQSEWMTTVKVTNPGSGAASLPGHSVTRSSPRRNVSFEATA